MATNVDLSNVTDEQRAQIIREERDALIIAWANGRLAGQQRVTADWLNERVEALGVNTVTGDAVEWFTASIYGTYAADHFIAR